MSLGPYGWGPRQPGPLNQAAWAAKAATAVAPRKEPRSEPVVNALPVGRIDLKKAEEERKAAEEAAARAPPVDSKIQLVEKLRKAQSTENGRVLWWSFCTVHANGKLDPEAHDTAFLLTFFECFEKGDIIEEPGCPPHVRNPQAKAAGKGNSKGKSPGMKGKGGCMNAASWNAPMWDMSSPCGAGNWTSFGGEFSGYGAAKGDAWAWW